ncbi:MAG: hypothetical protein QOK43_1983 [Acidimicrobiaceae bacterium]|nr:hypothetical protein [Acidimicrobiaceae bacterium]
MSRSRIFRWPARAVAGVVASLVACFIVNSPPSASAGPSATTLPTPTTSSSLPCIKAWSTNPPASVEVCPPVARA